MWYTTLVTLFCLCSISGTLGQFQFFEQMFGGGHPGQHRQPSHAPQWASQADAVPCSDYLCPDTLVCVTNPAQCPCPNPEDIKCLIPDAEENGAATVLCVRGANECAEVERLSRKFGK